MQYCVAVVRYARNVANVSSSRKQPCRRSIDVVTLMKTITNNLSPLRPDETSCVCVCECATFQIFKFGLEIKKRQQMQNIFNDFSVYICASLLIYISVLLVCYGGCVPEMVPCIQTPSDALSPPIRARPTYLVLSLVF